MSIKEFKNSNGDAGLGEVPVRGTAKLLAVDTKDKNQGPDIRVMLPSREGPCRWSAEFQNEVSIIVGHSW